MNEKGTRVYVQIQIGVSEARIAKQKTFVCVCVCVLMWRCERGAKRHKILCSLLLNRKCFFFPWRSKYSSQQRLHI